MLLRAAAAGAFSLQRGALLHDGTCVQMVSSFGPVMDYVTIKVLAQQVYAWTYLSSGHVQKWSCWNTGHICMFSFVQTARLPSEILVSHSCSHQPCMRNPVSLQPYRNRVVFVSFVFNACNAGVYIVTFYSVLILFSLLSNVMCILSYLDRLLCKVPN